jgi:CDP-paratose 2-epimerase
MRILITGGAGFVGSNLAAMFAATPGAAVIAFDNLRRRGSELALPRLRDAGVTFVHGDIRNPEDLESLPAADLLIECSAEPSVHAGYDGGARYLVNTNLTGTFNCLEYARRHGTAVVFLSTSRVYSMPALRGLPLRVEGDRFELPAGEAGRGWCERGIAEDFPTTAPRSLYGTTKLASELLVEEYNAAFGLRTIVNRCGVITGPWQMGKVDQGFFVLWAACHLYGRPLRYIGFGGRGRQVRDVLAAFDRHSGHSYNVGGGARVSISLAELTEACRSRTASALQPGEEPATRPADIPYYVTDHCAVTRATGWAPERTVAMILDEVLEWLVRHRAAVESVLE